MSVFLAAKEKGLFVAINVESECMSGQNPALKCCNPFGLFSAEFTTQLLSLDVGCDISRRSVFASANIFSTGSVPIRSPPGIRT